MKLLCGILLFVAYLCMSLGHSLPKNFEKCKAEDGACILRRINEVLRSYPQGFDELHLQKIEPLYLKLIRVEGNPKNPVNMDLTLRDSVIHGLSNITFTRFSGFTKDPKDVKEFHCDGLIPYSTLDGQYKASGKFLVVPITGEGDIHIAIKNLQLKILIKASSVEKDGKVHIKLDKSQVKGKAERVLIDPKNLFNGEKTLAEATIKVINENWEVLWDEISPKVLSELLSNIKNNLEAFLDNFTYEDLFA